MNKRIENIIKDQFFSSAFWVFLGTGFINFGNYFYHLIMGRMLGAADYGALESVISVFYILSVPTLTLSLVIVKFVSSYKGKKDNSSIEIFYNYIFRKVMLWGFLLFVILLVLTPLFNTFLHLPSLFLALLLPVTFLLNLPFVVNKSMLQGYSMFFKFSFLNFLETFLKVGLGLILVLLGWGVIGAFGGITISAIIVLTLSFFLLYKNVKVDGKLSSKFVDRKELLKFILPTFITTLSITSLFTTDIILVRHFFPGPESGYYSALSILGKIIYFASSPIILVLFPMASERFSSGSNYKSLLKTGLLMTLIISISITGIYFLFPEIMIGVLFGNDYLAVAGLLGIFGIFITLFSLCATFANFYLSVHHIKTSVLVLLAAIFQIILIVLFHANLLEVIMVSVIICFLLLISLLLYYPRVR